MKPLIGAAHINWSHPLAQGLVFGAVLNEGVGVPRALYGASAPTALGATPAWTLTDGGLGVQGPGRWGYTAPRVSGLLSLTIATQIVPLDTSTRVDVFGRWDTEKHFLVILNLTAGKVSAAAHDGAGYQILDSDVSVTAGALVSIVATIRQGDAMRLYLNGRQAGSIAIGTLDQSGGTSPVTLCGSADAPTGVAPSMYGLIYRYALPVSLIEDLYDHPYALLVQARRRRRVSTSAPATALAWNFRDSFGYVFDVGGEIWIGADIVNGWSTDAVNATDGDGGLDYRLVGSCWIENTGVQGVLTLSLPSPGTYLVRLAAGATFNSTAQYVQILDDTTPRLTIDKPAGWTLYNFYDAAGTLHAAAAWPGGNAAVPVTFTTTTLKVVLGTPGSFPGTWSAIAHLSLVASAGPSVTSPVHYQRRRALLAGAH